MRFALKIEEYIVKAEKAVVVGLIFAMVGLSFLQVLLRIFFHSGIVWLDPLLRHMVLWAGLTGAALAARYSHHFALEAFVKSAPKKLHRPLEIFADVFMIAASCLLFHASYKFIRDEFAAGSTAFYIDRLGVPGGWAEIIIPASFALIAYHAFMGIFRPEDAPEASAFGVPEVHK
ncbi:MAG: TRAP transporter small permease subunit [Elusimicrobiota bacterium]|nr:TRAP transporter small permease subunit [Elusimicrobiota bacterium]